MGNIIKRQSRIFISLNNTCPICLDLITNDITLSCGHSYDAKCIQQYLINNYTNITCPYCRKYITNSDMKKIFKKFYSYNYKLNEYGQQNVISISSNLIIKRFTLLNYNDIQISIPHFQNHTRPIFIKIPRVYRLCIIPYLDDKLFDNQNRLNYKYKMAAYIGKTQWSKFLCNNFTLINQLNTSLLSNIEVSNDKINLYVKNPENILTINSLNGTMEQGIKLYSNICEIIIKIYLLKIDNETNLVNELYAINYYE